MSYILDALKKAERERHLTKIPTLETVHRKSWQPRRGQWLWIAAVVAVVNVALLIWLFRPEPTHETLAQAPSAPVATRPLSEKPAPAPAQELPAPASPPAQAVAPIVAPVEPAPPTHAPARPPEPPARPETIAKRAEPAPRPAVAPAPVTPKVETTKPRGANTPAPPAASPTPAPEPPVVAAVPERPAAPPAAAAPPRAAARTGPAPTLQDMTAGELEGIPKLTLQFLVYSDAPQDRLVFINNQKYLEGQSIDGKVLVEAIQPDGVTLSYHGKRFSLRQ